MIALYQLHSCVFCLAPEFLDGTAYTSSELLIHQGSSQFSGPNEPIKVASEDYEIDFEAKIGVIVNDVPMRVSADEAVDFIKYFVLINDISLRNLSGLHGKPQSSLSPFVAMKDGLDAWDGKRIHLSLVTRINGKQFGKPNTGINMEFDFPTLIAHAAKTRPLKFRTIIGTGAVANKKGRVGHSSIAEKRKSKPETPFLKFGDVIKIEMFDENKKSIFGAIEQEIVKA